MTGPARSSASSAPSEDQLLRHRAEQLARRPVGGLAEPDALQALAFSIGGHPCVLELEWVCEVRALGELLPVPLAPPSLLGLAHLRGRMLPVLDVAALLGADSVVPGLAHRLLVLGRGSPVFGLAATEVHGLRQVSAQLAARRGAPLESVRPGLVRGVTREGDLFLDGDRLLGLARGGAP